MVISGFLTVDVVHSALGWEAHALAHTVGSRIEVQEDAKYLNNGACVQKNHLFNCNGVIISLRVQIPHTILNLRHFC